MCIRCAQMCPPTRTGCPAGHDSTVPVRRASTAPGRTVPSFLIRHVIEMDPSFTLTLSVVNREFTPVARSFLPVYTAALIRKCSGKGFLAGQFDAEAGDDALRSKTPEYRSCVVFHNSIVNIIKRCGISCPNRILSPGEVRVFANEFTSRTFGWGVLHALDNIPRLINLIEDLPIFYGRANLAHVVTPQQPEAEDAPPSAGPDNDVDDVD